MCFSHCQNKYSKSLAWTWNFPPITVNNLFKFQAQDSHLEYLFWQCEKHIPLSEKKPPLAAAVQQAYPTYCKTSEVHWNNFCSIVWFGLGLTIDVVTSIIVIISIGLCVDYSAHIAHAFLTSQGNMYRIKSFKYSVVEEVIQTPIYKLFFLPSNQTLRFPKRIYFLDFYLSAANVGDFMGCLEL